MPSQHLRNVSIAKFESFLELAQCEFIHTNSGYDKWTRADLRRPIIFQNHINPIPEFIIKNNLRVLDYTKKQFFQILEGKLIVNKVGDEFVLQSIK